MSSTIVGTATTLKSPQNRFWHPCRRQAFVRPSGAFAGTAAHGINRSEQKRLLFSATNKSVVQLPVFRSASTDIVPLRQRQTNTPSLPAHRLAGYPLPCVRTPCCRSSLELFSLPRWPFQRTAATLQLRLAALIRRCGQLSPTQSLLGVTMSSASSPALSTRAPSLDRLRSLSTPRTTSPSVVRVRRRPSLIAKSIPPSRPRFLSCDPQSTA